MGILLSEDGVAYREFFQAFSADAERQGFLLTTILPNTPLPESGLIVAVGIKSVAIALNGHTPVLGVLLSKAGYEKLLHELPAHREKNAFSAIYLDQPSKRQVDLVVAALPEVKNVGLLLSPQSPDMASLRKAVADNHLVLHEQAVTSVDSLYRDLQSLLQKSDVLLAIPDMQIYNSSTMRNILLATYHGGVPVMGFSAPYVRAGALCAVFSTPGQVALQAADMSKQFAETGRLPAAQYPAEFEVMVNQQVAHSLGIQVKEAAVLARQIKAAASAGGAK